MLRLENIYFSYENGEEILKNICVNIKKGEKIVFLGENGTGKSTLFLIMNGLLKAQKGKIILDNKEIGQNKKELIELRKKVGIVFQDPDVQIFAPTVFQEIAYGLSNLGYNEKEINEKVENVLKELDMENLRDRPCHHLSYGQKKRVSIASIVAMEPDIMILDEPTAWLDYKNSKKVMEIFEKLNKKGKTLIISTHEIDFAYSIADYVYMMKDGKIVKEGNKIDVFNDFETFKKLNLDLPNILKIQKFLQLKGIDEKEYEIYLKENY